MLELCVERKELLAPQRPQVPLCTPAVGHFAFAHELCAVAVVARRLWLQLGCLAHTAEACTAADSQSMCVVTV